VGPGRVAVNHIWASRRNGICSTTPALRRATLLVEIAHVCEQVRNVLCAGAEPGEQLMAALVQMHIDSRVVDVDPHARATIEDPGFHEHDGGALLAARRPILSHGCESRTAWSPRSTQAP